MVDARPEAMPAAGSAGPGASNPPGSNEPIVLSGRYRLVRQVGTGTGRTLAWLAEDQTLARLVEIRILPDPPGSLPSKGSHSPQASALLDAAQQSGRIVHPRLAAVYDTSIGRSRDGRRLTYVVREWCPGRSLEAVLRDGPLAPAAAAAVVRGIADGLDALHAAGLVHGRLHPGNVLLPAAVVAEVTHPGPFRGGDPAAAAQPAEVKVSDAVLSASLAKALDAVEHQEGTRSLDRLHPDELVAVDTADLARVLFACLTGQWPLWQGPEDLPTLVADWPGLPTVTSGDRLRSVRAASPALPKVADEILARALDPAAYPRETPLRQPIAFATATEPLLRFAEVASEDPPEVEPEQRRKRGGFLRHWTVRWGVRLALLAVLGVVGYTAGERVGKVPGTTTAKAAPSVKPSAGASASSSPSPTGPAALDLTGAVSAFDPQGGGGEDDANVPKAVDGDPSTGWQTELYYSSGTFGGQKKGVGLLVDLGSAKTIGEVQLALTGNGATTAELRAAPTAAVAPTTFEQFSTLLATGSDESSIDLKASSKVSSRFWLVWLTKLPQSPQGGGWQGEIDEMTFLPS